MTTNLHQAHNQWCERPDDERYWDLEGLYLAALASDQNRERITCDPTKLEFSGDDYNNLALSIPGNRKEPVSFSDWSFRQIAGKLGAPAEYLQSLPASKTADLLNFHLADPARRSFAKESVAHVSRGRVECLVSGQYGYIPNHKIVTGLQALQERGWIVPPGRPNGKTDETRVRKATKEDAKRWAEAGVGWGLGEGADLAPSGLYLGDRNMFAFMVKGGGELDLGTGQVLQRGAFFRNSEVGDGACTFTMFAYDHVCGNHIVWDVKDVKEISIRHVGVKAESRAIEAVATDLDKWIEDGTRDMIRTIELSKTTVLGKTQDEVVESIFNNRRVKISRKDLAAAYYLADTKDSDRVNPRSIWGMVSGVTRLSQEVYGNADKRTTLDSQVPNLLAMVN